MIDRTKLLELAGDSEEPVVVTRRWLKQVAQELGEIGGRPVDILPPAIATPTALRQAHA